MKIYNKHSFYHSFSLLPSPFTFSFPPSLTNFRSKTPPLHFSVKPMQAIEEDTKIPTLKKKKLPGKTSPLSQLVCNFTTTNHCFHFTTSNPWIIQEPNIHSPYRPTIFTTAIYNSDHQSHLRHRNIYHKGWTTRAKTIQPKTSDRLLLCTTRNPGKLEGPRSACFAPERCRKPLSRRYDEWAQASRVSVKGCPNLLVYSKQQWLVCSLNYVDQVH